MSQVNAQSIGLFRNIKSATNVGINSVAWSFDAIGNIAQSASVASKSLIDGAEVLNLTSSNWLEEVKASNEELKEARKVNQILNVSQRQLEIIKAYENHIELLSKSNVPEELIKKVKAKLENFISTL